MELASVNTPAAAFVAGLVTSLHCAGMCGPLACLLGPRRGERVDLGTIHTTYHSSRLTSYTLLGAVAGAAGAFPATWFNLPLVRALPWILVLYFMTAVFQLGRWLPRLAFLGGVQTVLIGWGRGCSGLQVAAIMGFGTPLLPCGPLYFLIAMATFAGSAMRGAELMLAFGLGTVPLLWLAQAQLGWLRGRLTPIALGRVRTLLALVSAAVLVWRLRADLGFTGNSMEGLICH